MKQVKHAYTSDLLFEFLVFEFAGKISGSFMVLMQLEPITITAWQVINTNLQLWCRSFDNDHVYGRWNANYGRE